MDRYYKWIAVGKRQFEYPTDRYTDRPVIYTITLSTTIIFERHEKEYSQDMEKGHNYEKDPFNYEMVENGKKCSKVYVFVFSRSDYPNEIGIATSDIPFIVEDSNILFKKEVII